MPKKFVGENTKAQEARARKAAAKVAENEKVEKEKEDAYWQDDNKHVQRKLHRKEERERKKLEESERKKELKALAEAELNSGPKTEKQPPKVTRSQVEERIEKQKQTESVLKAEEEKKKSKVVEAEDLLTENVNRLILEGEQAQTVDEALQVLSEKETEVDRHPEKRVRAAYNAFEECRLPQLKSENPNMRLSQLKQMLKKEWQKSPENPLNQR